MAVHKPITQRDIIAKPQYKLEGHTVATYGILPNNPTFAQTLADAILIDTSSHQTADSRHSGDVNRQARLLVRKGNTVALRGKVQSTDEALLQWFMKEPDRMAGSPDESRSLLQAYDDKDGDPVYELYKGCKPMSATLAGGRDYTTLDATMSFLEKGTAAAKPSGSTLASTITNDPLLQYDIPASPLTFHSVVYEIRAFAVTVSFEDSLFDAARSKDILYREPAIRSISGSISVFQQDDSMHADAREQTERAAVLKVSSGITLSFTGMVLDPSGPDTRGDSADSTIEEHSFTANDMTIA